VQGEEPVRGPLVKLYRITRGPDVKIVPKRNKKEGSNALAGNIRGRGWKAVQ